VNLATSTTYLFAREQLSVVTRSFIHTRIDYCVRTWVKSTDRIIEVFLEVTFERHLTITRTCCLCFLCCCIVLHMYNEDVDDNDSYITTDFRFSFSQSTPAAAADEDDEEPARCGGGLWDRGGGGAGRRGRGPPSLPSLTMTQPSSAEELELGPDTPAAATLPSRCCSLTRLISCSWVESLS